MSQTCLLTGLGQQEPSAQKHFSDPTRGLLRPKEPELAMGRLQRGVTGTSQGLREAAGLQTAGSVILEKFPDLKLLSLLKDLLRLRAKWPTVPVPFSVAPRIQPLVTLS